MAILGSGLGGTGNGEGDEEVHGDAQDGNPAEGHAEAQGIA